MKNRIPTKPNRYAVYDDAHNFLRHEYHERADEPTEVGTAINKATLLSDETAAVLRLAGEEATVNNALMKLAVDSGFVFAVTIKTNDGFPISGIAIPALTSIGGSAAVATNQDGYAIGVSAQESIAISVSGFLDLDDYNQIHRSSGVVTRVSVTLQKKAVKEIQLTTSGTFRFSSVVKTFDAHLVGGGGAGGDAYNNNGGGGGGGGDSLVSLNISAVADRSYTAEIGAGGQPNGTSNVSTRSGGITRLIPSAGNRLSADGGQGGHYGGTESNAGLGGVSGNGGSGGKGGYVGDDGKSGTIHIFNEAARVIVSGGGGGGTGGTNPESGGGYYPGGKGGAPNGGCGAQANSWPGSGMAPGGGGGGCGCSIGNKVGAAGGTGCIYIRWRF